MTPSGPECENLRGGWGGWASRGSCPWTRPARRRRQNTVPS